MTVRTPASRAAGAVSDASRSPTIDVHAAASVRDRHAAREDLVGHQVVDRRRRARRAPSSGLRCVAGTPSSAARQPRTVTAPPATSQTADEEAADVRLVRNADHDLASAAREAFGDPVAPARVEGAERIVDEQERRLAGLGGDRRREPEAQAEGRGPGLAVRSERPGAEVADGQGEVVAVRPDEGGPAEQLVGPSRRELLAERLLRRDPATFGAYVTRSS